MAYEYFRYGRRVDATNFKIRPANAALPFIQFTDSSHLNFVSTAGAVVIFSLTDIAGANRYFAIEGGTDAILKTYNGKHLYLDPDGAGLVKFGTHTGTGDVVSNGHITIKDAGGTDRKLMTTV